MKIVILDGYTENPGDLSWNGLKALGELTVYDRTPAEEIVNRIGDSEIVITNKTPISKEIIDKCTNIRYIGVLATGYNVIDFDYAAEKNIPVCNVPTYGTKAVAQFTIALLLEICHHVGEHSLGVHLGDWQKSVDWCYWNYPLIELDGKTMGIIGFGRIGQNTAKIATALGMKILAYDQYPNKELECEDIKYTSLDELFKNSDVISLHCPLFKDTEGIINKENIEKMRNGVIIINTSRGSLINEEDLSNGLKSGKIYGAGLDVVSVEPVKENNPLLGCKNCIITPHIAWASKESRERLLNIAVDNVKSFLNGNPVNVVNKLN